jgi:RNA polymerase sigma-70 factor (ECF subfamily)
MTDDVWVRMPPLPFEYRGPAAAHRFFTAIDALPMRFDKMMPVRANRQPAWGEYSRNPRTGGLHLRGVIVVGLAGDRISELTRFETNVAPYLGLTRTLDDHQINGTDE